MYKNKNLLKHFLFCKKFRSLILGKDCGADLFIKYCTTNLYNCILKNEFDKNWRNIFKQIKAYKSKFEFISLKLICIWIFSIQILNDINIYFIQSVPKKYAKQPRKNTGGCFFSKSGILLFTK